MRSMNGILLIILPWLYRFFRIPGRVASRINRLFSVDVNQLSTPMIADCRFGLKIMISNPSDLIQNQLFFQGYFEHKETRILGRLLKPGMTVLDVGANIGWHSLIAASKVGSSGRVISFEPVSATYGHLIENLRINNCGNVEAHEIGLSNDSRNIDIYSVEKNNDGSNSIFPSASSQLLQKIAVREGAALLRASGVLRVDFCKIDVEGAEIEVLDGLDEYLSNGLIKIIMIELNERALRNAGRSGRELVEKLLNLGYKITDIKNGLRLSFDTGLPIQANLLCSL